MALMRMARRNRTDAAGSLGAVQRSIGYLQGGYKDTTIHSRVQLFNTTTQVGSLVYDTGYQRSYRPGLSGENSGYFSISDTVQYNKFNYINASASAASFTTAEHPSVSSVDAGIYSEAWLLTTTYASWNGGGAVNNWNRINLSTDSLASQGVLSTIPGGTTRQALSTPLAGCFWSTQPYLASLNYSNKSITTAAAHAYLTDGTNQIAAGMTRDAVTGYFVGMNSRNIKVNFSGATVSSQAVATGYTYHFGESHTLNNNTAGFMMAGYSDTTGRYGTTQHGLCQKIVFSNESIVTLPDLVLPQSSGQMMQGF